MGSLSGNESEESWDGADNAKTTIISTTSPNLTSAPQPKDPVNSVSDVADIFTPEVVYNDNTNAEPINGFHKHQRKESIPNSTKRKKNKSSTGNCTAGTKQNHKSKEEKNTITTVPLVMDSNSGSNSMVAQSSTLEMKELPPISLNSAIKMEKILYPAADLAKIPPDILLQLIRTGSLNIHTEDGKSYNPNEIKFT